MEEKKEKAEGLKQTLEPLREDSVTAAFPQWIKETHPLDLLTLPFDELDYHTDLYEMALIVLHLRNWHYKKIHTAFHVFICPILWPFFSKRPHTLTIVNIALRWFILITSLIGAFFLIRHTTKLILRPDLFFFLSSVLLTALLFINIFVSIDYFKKWKIAYTKMSEKLLRLYLPPQAKKKHPGETE